MQMLSLNNMRDAPDLQLVIYQYSLHADGTSYHFVAQRQQHQCLTVTISTSLAAAAAQIMSQTLSNLAWCATGHQHDGSHQLQACGGAAMC